MSTFFRILRYAGRYSGQVSLAVVLSILGVLIELARPWPIKFVVDYVLGDRPMPASLTLAASTLPGAGSANGQLAWAVAAALLVVVGAALISLAAMYVTIAVSQRLVYDLSLDLFAKLQRLSLAYHSRHPLGDLLQRLSGDVYVIYFVISPVLLPAVTSILSLGGMFLIMASIDLSLALIAMSVAPFLAIALFAFSKPMDVTTERQYATQGAWASLAEQSLSNIRIIQGFAREPYVQRQMRARAEEVDAAYNRAIRVSSAYQQLSLAITGAGAAVLLGLGSERVLAGRLSLGDLLVFLGYLASFYAPVNALSSSVGYAIQVIARGRRIFEVLDARDEVPEPQIPLNLGRVRGEILFDGVTFGYGEPESAVAAAPVLRNVSFTAQPGQIVAIVGATGAGKSSMISLIPRFYDPWHGRILIDGIDAREVSLRTLRENVSLVLQEPFLFPMSVADNIAFGRPGATEKEIVAAAQMAQAHEFIVKLPQGYDTVLAEKGISLSGGQRQRIAIARAIIKDAPILIFDEPTSALDARTEGQIFEALSALMRGKTTFIISHRLSTIRRADHILALEHGRIVEQGTHEELLRRGGVYATLYRHQHLAVV